MTSHGQPSNTIFLEDLTPVEHIPTHFSKQSRAAETAQESLGDAGPQAPQNAVDIEDVPPNGGYGWVCTICVFLVNGHTWGVNSAWAIFLAHYLSHNTFPGATHLEYALIGGLSISQSLVVSPLVAISNNRLGTRASLIIGTLLVFLALFTAGSATKIWHLFLSQGFCFGWGMGFLYITATSVLPQWFSSKRSLAIGIASSGAGLGGLAYNLATGVMIPKLGLEWSYRVLALCTLAANMVSAILLKDRNKSIQPVQTAFSWREYGRPEVMLVAFWGFMTELGYIVLLYSLPNYAISIGLTHSQGSIVSAVLNLGLGIGRPAIGYYSDALGRINIATLITFLCAVFCLAIWVPSTTYAPLLVFALLSGICCGIFWATVAPVTAEVTGMKRFPSVFSMICLLLVLPTTFAEGIALQIVSASGYVSAQVFVGCMFLAGATSIWFLRSWKLHDIDQKALRDAWQDLPPRPTQRTRHDFWLTPGRLVARKRV